MTITFYGKNKFKIKCKEGIITTGESIKINDFTLTEPGEYEVAGISVENIDGIYNFFAEDINMTYLKRNKILTNTELEKVEGADILFLPVGEIIEPKTALEIANQIEPKILIPMHYQSVEELKKIKEFSPEVIDELKLSKNAFDTEERKVIALNIKNE